MALHADFEIGNFTFDVSAGDVGETEFTCTREEDGESVPPEFLVITDAEDNIIKIKLVGSYE